MTERSSRNAARVVGIALPVAFVILAVSTFAVLDPILAFDDPADLARSILENEASFRLGVIGNLLYGIGNIAVAAALYVLLRPAGATLAAVASAFRLAWAFTWIVVVLDFITTLRMLEDPTVAAAFGDRSAALALQSLPGY